MHIHSKIFQNPSINDKVRDWTQSRDGRMDRHCKKYIFPY
jgi:hypothetical protein